jgi:hypothetical protein
VVAIACGHTDAALNLRPRVNLVLNSDVRNVVKHKEGKNTTTGKADLPLFGFNFVTRMNIEHFARPSLSGMTIVVENAVREVTS